MNRNVLKTGLVGVLAALLVWTGCGDEQTAEPLECGDATELRDGECVAVDDDCDDGEVLTSGGDCIEPDQFCEDDSAHYDAGADECVTDDEISCGEGTVEEDGVCVADVDSYECGDGTVLVDGVCELAEEVCGPGTEYSDGECNVSDDACSDGAEFDIETNECSHLAELECGDGTVERDGVCEPLHSVADELADEADFDYEDGEPIVADEDASVVFTGTLDDSLSQTFDLEAQEGDWLEVTIYPRGLPSPGLEVTDSIDNWRRAVAPAMQSVPSRTMVMPGDDTYSLTVNTSLSEDDAAMSDSSWQYVGEVEVLETPETTQWDLEEGSLNGDLSETTDNYIELDVTDTDDLYLTAGQLGEDVVEPTVERWNDEEFGGRWDLESGDRAELDVGDGDELVLHFDATEFNGVRTDYEVSGQLTETIPPGGFYFDEVSAEAGETLMISHRNDQADPVGVRVFRDDEFQRQFHDVSADNKTSYDPDETRREYYYVEQDGDFLVEFQNTSDEELTSFVSTSGVDQHLTFDLIEGEISEFDEFLGGENLDPGDWKVVYVDTPNPALLEGTAVQDETSFSRAPDVTLYDLDRQEIAHEPSDFSNDTDFDFVVPEQGRYLLAIQPESSFGSIGDVSLEMTGEVVEHIDGYSSVEMHFDALGFDILSGNISVHDGPSPTMRLFNPDQFMLFEQPDADGFQLMEIIPGPGEYTLEFENHDPDPVVGLSADIHVTTPFDILNVATNFSESYALDGLEEGERDMLLFEPETDYLYDLSFVLQEGESGTFRLWDVDDREVLLEEDDSEEIDLENQGIDEGTYVLEFVAETDIDDYSVIFSGSDISFVDEVRVHEPDLEIAPNGTIESSALAVEDCDQILDVSFGIEFTSTPTNSDLNIYLYPPGLDDPIAVREDSFGNHSTVYPDSTTPDESFDPMLGTVGTGVWSIDIVNNHGSTWAELDEWSIHLTCTHGG